MNNPDRLSPANYYRQKVQENLSPMMTLRSVIKQKGKVIEQKTFLETTLGRNTVHQALKKVFPKDTIS